MTVSRLIKELQDCNPELHVKDIDGDEIMYLVDKGDGLYMEPKSQTDLHSTLDAFFDYCTDCAMGDEDVIMELQDVGITLEDLKDYKHNIYEWAIKAAEEHGLEW